MKLIANTSNNRTFQNILEPPQSYQDIISNEAAYIFRVINYSILCTLIALFGIFSNTVNMIVFYRQGFNTTTNICFFALAISDMLCLVTTIMSNSFLNPFLETADINFITQDMQYLTGGWLHACSGRISSWITVFITAERCLGVTLPLKVKQIITLKRTTIAMCTIFFVNLATILPEYTIAYLDWKFVPARNRSLVGLVYRSYKDQAYGLSFTLTSVSGMTSLFCVIFLTIFLVTKLSWISKWRKTATGGTDNSETVSTRDKKAMKMVVMIAIVLIVCYIPGTSLALVSPFVPEFMIGRAFDNSFYSFWSIAFIFDTINSSVNVFLYYRMSTKYKHTFNEIFSSCIKSDIREYTNSAGRADLKKAVEN